MLLLEGQLQATGRRFGIVASRTNEIVVSRLLDGALDGLRRMGAADEDVFRTLRIPAAKLREEAIDQTGVGDVYRAGLVAARIRGLSWDLAGRVGSTAAAISLEAEGPQPARRSMSSLRAELYRRI